MRPRAVGRRARDRRRRRRQQRLVPADRGRPRRHRRRLRGVVVDGAGDLLLANPTATVLRVLAPRRRHRSWCPSRRARSMPARRPARCASPCPACAAAIASTSSWPGRAAAVECGRRPRRHGRRHRPGAGARCTDTRRGRGVQHRPQPDRLDRRHDRRGRRPPTGRDAGCRGDRRRRRRRVDVLVNDIDPDGGTPHRRRDHGPGRRHGDRRDDVALGRQVVRYTPAARPLRRGHVHLHDHRPDGLTASAIVTVASPASTTPRW